jgi:hypothetical protein
MDRTVAAKRNRRLIRTFIMSLFVLSPAILLMSSCGRPAITTANTTLPIPSNSSEPSLSGPALVLSGSEQLQSAPEIPGAKKNITQKNSQPIVIYTALPDNKYGVQSGTCIGEFRYYVYIDGERTGGLALAAPIVSQLLEAALQALPEGQARWLLTLPADLSDCSAFAQIQIDRNAQPFADKPYYIQISAPGETMSVINILDSSHRVVIDKFPIYGLHYIISQKSLDTMKIIAGEEMAFLFVIAALKNDQADQAGQADLAYGDRVGVSDEPVLAGLSSVRGPLTVHEYSCILRCEGCPVFLMSNDKLIGPGEEKSK